MRYIVIRIVIWIWNDPDIGIRDFGLIAQPYMTLLTGNVSDVNTFLISTYIASGTELPLSIFNFWCKLLKQSFLYTPDGRRLPTCLQGQLGTRREWKNQQWYLLTNMSRHLHPTVVNYVDYSTKMVRYNG